MLYHTNLLQNTNLLPSPLHRADMPLSHLRLHRPRRWGGGAVRRGRWRTASWPSGVEEVRGGGVRCGRRGGRRRARCVRRGGGARWGREARPAWRRSPPSSMRPAWDTAASWGGEHGRELGRGHGRGGSWGGGARPRAGEGSWGGELGRGAADPGEGRWAAWRARPAEEDDALGMAAARGWVRWRKWVAG